MDRSLERDESDMKGLRNRFIGRTQHLDLFEQSLHTVHTGQPQILFIQGDPGIGKTRLLHEDFSLPYLPLIESLFTQLTQLSEERQKSFEEDKNIIQHFLRGQEGISLSLRDRERTQFFRAVTRATMKLAQGTPLLLILDDLHWADQSSIDLFNYLTLTVADTARRESVPLFILGTFRPLEPQNRLALATVRFQREQICRVVQLPGLSASEIHELLQDLGIPHPSRQLVTTLNQATQGNPLLIREAVHALVEQGALQERAGYTIAVSGFLEFRLPYHITAAVTARLQDLSEDCRHLLTLAAFLGARFSLPLLSAVHNITDEHCLDLLEEGVAQGLLLSKKGEFSFAHPVIKHVFYTAPIEERRQRIHLQIAHTFQQLYAENLDPHLLEIAHHLINAGPAAEADQVAQYARRAGDKAFALFAWGDAAHYYEAALATTESVPYFSTQDRADLHYQAGLAHYHAMDVGSCLHQYERAIEAYRQLNDVQGLTRVLIEQNRSQRTLASVSFGTEKEIEPLQAALDILEEEDLGLRGRVLATLAQAYWHAKQPEKTGEIAKQALAIGKRMTDDWLCAQASHGLALAQVPRFQMREALENWQAALDYAKRAEDLVLAGERRDIPIDTYWICTSPEDVFKIYVCWNERQVTLIFNTPTVPLNSATSPTKERIKIVKRVGESVGESVGENEDVEILASEHIVVKKIVSERLRW